MANKVAYSLCLMMLAHLHLKCTDTIGNISSVHTLVCMSIGSDTIVEES